MQIIKLDARASADWPVHLLQRGTFTATDSWMKFAGNAYNCTVHRFEAREHGVVAGFLSLVHIDHPIFGNSLMTSPFASYGGFAFESIEVRNALLDSARQLADELKVEHVNVRFDDGASNPPDGWVQHPVYFTFLIDLLPSPEEMMPRFSSDHRNHIRKSLKKGFTVRFGHLDLLDDAYEAIARSMHELGSPYHNKTYLMNMAQAMGADLEFVVQYTNLGDISGGGVFIKAGDIVTNLHANILRAHRSSYAGEHLYWSVIDRYARAGLKTLDLGRSLLGSGNEAFKMKWNPRRVKLAYWFYLRDGREIPALDQKNPKFQIAIAMWKLLPAFIIRPIGPYLIKGLA